MNVEYSGLLKACGCEPWGVYNDNGVLLKSFNTKEEAENFVKEETK